jgi:hypothetical protein
MKKLVIPALLVPSMAMAGVVLVDDGAPPRAGNAPVVSVAASSVMATQISVGGAGALVGGPISVGDQITADPGAGRVWTAKVGSTLRESVQAWSDQAKWHLIWDAPDGPDKQVNYPIKMELTFHGSVDQAISQCIALYEKAPKPLQVIISPEQRGVIVQRKNY